MFNAVVGALVELCARLLVALVTVALTVAAVTAIGEAALNNLREQGSPSGVGSGATER
ncbi:MAG: hypothetical protein JWO60_3439 [Frankiales bacterium]|nr:hypothetical protein [Frankiales bacterium]